MIGKRIALLGVVSPIVCSASSHYLFSTPNNQDLQSITPLLTSAPKIPKSQPVVAKQDEPSAKPVSEPKKFQKPANIPKTPVAPKKSNTFLVKKVVKPTTSYKKESRPIPERSIPNLKFISPFINAGSRRRNNRISTKYL